MQSLPYSQDLSCLAIPINTLPDEKLKKALDEAVRSENYRQAKYINDELKRRKLSSSECSDESKS
jgi:protein-arginine kinase activator protein McsA